MVGNVRTGIDRIDEFEDLLGGKRLGLITGASGVGRDLRASVDILAKRYRLTTLFSPEHGIRGELQPGQKVETHVDKFSGLPAYSLFEDELGASMSFDRESVYMPPKEALDRIDIMVFDLQDVGSRYYTFASTLFFAMRACEKAGKPFVVLDRPNPIGGLVLEGNCHRKENFSFIGLTPVPIRHGMTLGELARYYQGEHGIGCELRVIPCAGWRQDMYFDETGLPFVCPSPNLPSLDAIALYNGTCLLAGTNASEGRGTTKPFEVVGAPYADPLALAEHMNALHLPGVRFRPAFFLPLYSKHAGTMCAGVQIHVDDRKAVRAVALGVHLVRAFQALFPNDFAFKPAGPDGRYHVDLDAGTGELRDLSLSAETILAGWDREARAFQATHDRYALYGV